MICKEIVTHLMRYLPRVTDAFSEYSAPSSVSVSGEDVIITMPMHLLKQGQPVCITHSSVSNPVTSIDSVSGGVQLTTQNSHDVTPNWPTRATVTVRSVLTPAADGTYKVVRVPGNNTVVISDFTEVGATDLELLEPIEYGIDGLYNITRINDNQFSFKLDFGETILPGFTLNVVSETVRVHTEIRISGTNSLERALKSYEKHSLDKAWLFVELGRFDPSKGNRTQTDATNEQPGYAQWMIPLIQPFALNVVVPSRGTTGRYARDFAELLRLPIYRSICGAVFDSGVSDTQLISAVTPEADGEPQYSKAFYAHPFIFSQVARLQNCDRLFADRTTPFRSIHIDYYSEDTENDEVIMELSADLDN